MKAGKVDRADVRARLVVGQVFRVGERLGIVRDRRSTDTGVVLSVDYVKKNRLHSMRNTRLEHVAGTVTAFATRAEFDALHKEAQEWKTKQARVYKETRKARQRPVEPSACATPIADLERRVLLIESTVCKYLLNLLKDSDADGSLTKYFEDKGGMRVQ
jgi:hypothetical protein